MCEPHGVRLALRQWKIWAGGYIALVGATATLNELSSTEHLGWYVASVVLTLPLSLFAIYPILFVAGVASGVTGGDPIQGNAFGAVAVVASFITLATINVAVVRGIFMLRPASPPEHSEA
jgi:hypothetical protein